MVRVAVPHVFRFRTSVWQADLDAFGELRSATLLRFLQETATRASTDAGFDAAYYAGRGTHWLVRRTLLTQFAPIRHGDDLEATTWIADFRRVRSRREYEVRAGERLVTRAWTDWVYVSTASGRPRRIPAEMQDAFAHDGAPALERPPFPEAPPPPDAARTVRRVELHELDALQHVNNAAYVHYVEQAAQDADARSGWSLPAQLAAGGRFRPVGHDLEYLDAAMYGDEITVHTWPRAVTSAAVERHALLTLGGRPLLRAISRYTWVAADGEPAAIPTELSAALRGAAALA
jgi:acyl-CoA thioester hydrolase